MPGRRDSRALIIQAARAEFGTLGFDGARVAAIARRAGVNKQLIFYYFRSKAGLYDAVTRAAALQLPAARTRSTSATGTLRHAVESMLATLRARPELVVALTRPRSRPDVTGPDHALADLERNLAAVISDGQGLGYFRDDADPSLVARQGVLLCVGFLAVEGRLTDPDLDAWSREVGETLVRRLAW